MLSALGRAARKHVADQVPTAGVAEQLGWSGGAAARHAARSSWQLQPSRHVVAGAPLGSEQHAAVLAKARQLAGPVGVLAGVFGAVCGVGGGVIIVPAIVSACKTIPQRVVSGTSLAAVVSTALASAYTYSSSGCVDLGAAALISPAAMLTAPLGARLTSRLNCTALRRILGYFLLAAAPLVPLKAYLLASGAQQPGDAAAAPSSGRTAGKAENAAAAAQPAAAASAAAAGASPPAASTPEPSSILKGIAFPPPTTAALLAATGAVAGLASGLLGVGGGVIVTPLLALLTPFAQATVLGTSLTAMIPPASAALMQHNRLGNVDWRMAAALAAGTAVGSVAGSNLALQAPPGYLEAAFCIGMLFLGRKTLQTAK